MVALFVVFTIFAFVLADLTIQYYNKKAVRSMSSSDIVTQINDVILPKDYFFSKNHTWLKLQPTGKVLIGLDDFLIKIVGEAKLKMIKKTGEEVKKGDDLFMVNHSGKELKIVSPISGTIVAVNDRVIDSSVKLGNDPYYKGWVLKYEPVKFSDELKNLLFENDAFTWMKTQIKMFRDFITNIKNEMSPVGVTMNDGGQVVRGVLQHADKEVWDEFNKKFLEL